MKKFKLLLSLMLLASTLGVAVAQGPDKSKSESKAASHVKTKYDKSKDRTTVTLKSMDLGGAMTREVSSLGQSTQLTLDVSFTYAGEHPAKPVDALTMKFTSRARYPVFQRGQNLMVVVDDQNAIPIGDTNYKSDAQTFYTDEMLTAQVPREIMERIRTAKTAKMFLGNREIAFRSEQLDDLREMTARMSP